MERLFVLLKRKPGLSFEEFRAHYEGSHALLGEKYFGHLFKSYRRNYIPTGARFSDHGTVENAYDCLTELVFLEPGGYQELRRFASDPESGAPLLRTKNASSIARLARTPSPSRSRAMFPDLFPLDEQLRRRFHVRCTVAQAGWQERPEVRDECERTGLRAQLFRASSASRATAGPRATSSIKSALPCSPAVQKGLRAAPVSTAYMTLSDYHESMIRRWHQIYVRSLGVDAEN